MRVVLADGRIAEVTPEKTKVSQSRSSGKNFPSRFSSHGQARCSTRRTITSSLHWEELDPATELWHSSGMSNAASAYIWNQDSTKKKDFTEWTCLRYIVYKAPETEPAILLAWADTSDDLAALKAAGQVLKALAGQGPWLRVQTWKNHCSMPQASPDYSIVVSMVNYLFADFWKNILASPIYRSLIKNWVKYSFFRFLFPPIMRILRGVGKIRDGKS